MKKVQTIQIEVQGLSIPVKVYHEDRRSTRFSIGAKHIILRLPYFLPPKQQKEDFEKFKVWVSESFKKNEKLREQFFGKTYQDGDTLKVGNRYYNLDIKFLDEKKHRAELHNQTIYLRLSKHDTTGHTHQVIKKLLSRLIANDYTPEIVRRVRELNNMYFQRPIKDIRFKYNQTNWGSCSNKSNLNFSSRLLFAPDDVIDYVIIHELAHLIELNHSPRFWKLVSDAMPDYKAKEKWLKENGHLCQF